TAIIRKPLLRGLTRLSASRSSNRQASKGDMHLDRRQFSIVLSKKRDLTITLQAMSLGSI
ncbi:hypothetical protein, partial [Acetobacter syzygii]|uniref:hypothetical protein n=1 Tax=Acetobacter syzygii TaxID=146476 RepID=UPI0039EB10AE